MENQQNNNKILDKNIESGKLKNALESINAPNQLLDSNFQKKLIKVIIDDDKYAEQIIDIININYFDGVLIKMLFKYIMDYYEKYNIIPKYDTLKDLVNENENDLTQKEHLLELITILKEYKLVDKSFVKDTALQFCQKQSLKNGIMNAIEAWDRGKYEDITKIIGDSMKFGDSKNAGHNYSKDADSRLKKHFRNPISSMKGLDSYIGGGLAGGELGVIMAPTGGGKSMMLVKLASNAYVAGKNVIYYTLELSERVVGNRFDSCLSQIPMKDIYEYPQAIKEKIEEIEKNGGKLYIKEYPTVGATVQTIKNHLKTLQREGFTPDVIFIDYADIMKSTSEYSEKRFSLTSIYEGIRGLAMEFNIPIWTATQSSRCLEINTIIETQTGKIEICKAKKSDLVMTHMGYKKITNIFPIEKQIGYKIKLKSGKEIIVSSNHRFPISSGEVISISDGLKIGDKLLTKK